MSHRFFAVLFLSFLSAGIWAEDADYQPKIANASDDGEKAIQTFKLAPGLKCELWAAEPMLANPVCLYVDDKGRVYLIETFRFGVAVDTGSSGLTVEQDLALRTFEERVAFIKNKYSKEIDRFYKEHERIRLIEDTKGTGKADKATVFADCFNDISDGIAAGVLPYKGDVYFACIPHVWKLSDKNGDGRISKDEKTSLSYGYGVHGGYLGHDLHGFAMGPDRKIYVSIGDRGAHIEKDGKVFDYPDEGAVYRFNPDGSEFEVFATGLRNPQELTFDDFGNLFAGDNNSDAGDSARIVHVIEGSDTGWRQGYQFMPTRGPWNAEKLWKPQFKGQAAYVLPPVADYANGPSGFTYYCGVGLGDNYKGHFFLANFSGGPGNSGVYSFALKPKGASFELIDSGKFIWNELATDCDFGPDGAMYISDWVNGWGKPNKGRIYKVYDPAHAQDPAVLETKKLLADGVDKQPTESLLKLLGHPANRVRQQAQFALADKGKAVVGELEKIASANPQQLARIHAIWALSLIGRTAPEALQSLPSLLSDKDFEIRAQAAKILGEHKVAAAYDKLVSLLKDENARVRSYAALSLGKIGNKAAASALFDMLKECSDEDPALRHAGVMGLLGLNAPDAILGRAGDPSPAVRMAVLLVLRRLKSAEIGRFVKDSDPTIVLEAARAINDVPIPEAFPALAALVAPDSGAAKKTENGNTFRVDFWDNLSGGLDALTKNPNYPDKPTSTQELSSFEMPMNRGDNYGARISGIITAPQTGDYTFWISADDLGELYLSTDDKPEHKQKIAAAPEYCSSRDWDKNPAQKSKPIALKAGQKYFIEAIMKEGAGDDNLAVGWQLPDGKFERPIGDAGGNDATAALPRAINAAFRLGRSTDAQALAAIAARKDLPQPLRVDSLNDLAQWAEPSPRDHIINLFRPLPKRDPAPAIEATKPILKEILSSNASAIVQAGAKAAAGLGIKDAAQALFDIVGNEKLALDARIEALKALSTLNAPNLLAAINRACSDKQVKLRQEGTAMRAKINPELAIPALEKALKEASIPEKQSALSSLGELKKPAADAILNTYMDKLLAGQLEPELQLDILEAAKASGDKSLGEKLAKYDATLPHDEFAKFNVSLKGGDADAGKKVFHESTNAQCLRCHKLDGKGGEVGPELRGVATRNKREYLLESVVNPSAQIAKGFEQVLIAQNDGKVTVGIIKSENDKEITVLGADGKPVTIQKSDIKNRRDQKQSAMPPMGEVLSRREIRDVVEYLSTLK